MIKKMQKHMRRASAGLVSAVLTAAVAATPSQAATPFQDVLVQPPNLAPPQRGSLAGTLSRVTFGAGDLSRGAYKLPLPIDAPSERGPLLAGVVPSYSPDTGISEWGAGWQTDLSIRRFRPLGEVDFATDDYTSPWGRLAAGTDGYYPAGLTSVVRVTPSAGGWTAVTSDGTRYRFNAVDAVVTSRGAYQWMLSRVDNVLGDTTTLQWTRNESGRAFLASVQWGGRNDGTQYRMSFDYEAVPMPFVSYTSGDKLVVDRRVSRATVAVKQDSGYAARWSYALAYQASPTGPAFYLQRVTKTFASGASDPPVVYDYDLGTERLATAQLQRVPGLDGFISSRGGLAIQPDRAVQTDLEQNGLVDLETSFDQSTVRQTAAGFVVEALPPADGAHPTCRPSPSLSNKPRTLARMHGEAVDPQVVWFKNNFDGVTTHALVCDRLGVPIYDQDLAGSWGLNENTRLADLDFDQRPDIVRVGFGTARVLRNTSSGPNGIAFELGPVTELTPQLTPLATWVLDFNGDARPDLLVRHANGVVVWLGKHAGEFEPEGTSYGFRTTNGLPLAGFGNYQMSHGDFNGDGRSDMVLTQRRIALLFANRGDAFVETPIAGLSDIPFAFSYPLVGDFAGTGNDAVVFVSDQQASALELTGPSTGLMRSADDGKGTVLQFSYGRARPAPGIIRRTATLTGLTVASSGYDPVTYSYDYDAPVMHTAGKFLVGFGSVTKRSPFLTEHVTLLNDDDIAGVRSGSRDLDDRTPGIVRFAQQGYDDVDFHGVRWLRPASSETGYRSGDGGVTLSTTTQLTTYEREICPTVATVTGPSGQLVKTSTLTTTSSIPDDLHCLAGSQRLFGIHANAALDFNYLVALDRNELGQVSRVTQFGATMAPLVLQEVRYGADHRVAGITAPGRGTSAVSYDAHGRLGVLTDPLGVSTLASSIDPVSDELLELRTARPDAASAAFFRYDERERLRASWDDVSGASSNHPLSSYAYQDATNATPGRIDSQILADAITGTSRRAVALIAADGDSMVSGTWLGDRYTLGTASITERNTLTQRSSFVGTMSEAALAALSGKDLRVLGTPLAETLNTGFGRALETTTTQQVNVVGRVTTEVALSTTELVTRVQQPGGFTAESAIDAAGQLVRKLDENGVGHRYRYDALGRLVLLETPDGAHALSFDSFGRPAQVTRAGLGSLVYGYDPTTGLLARKQHLDATGAVINTSDTHYDVVGRPLAVDQTSADASSTLGFDYDGQLGTAIAPGQLGRLTRVRGPGWERSALFDALGRAYEEHTLFDGWRGLTSEKTYRADGSVASDTLTIRDHTGAMQLTTTRETTLDSLGRVRTFVVDGAVLYTVSYDGEGRPARADFASGETLTFDYDPSTHQRNGHALQTPAATGGVGWERDPRGLIAAEIYTNGSSTARRAYGYDGRGALISASGTEPASYTYTASGLPDSISDVAGARTVHRTSDRLTVGDVIYTWDTAGRVIGKGEWTLHYGADGQLDRANRPGRQLDFIYDDSGHRLLKRVDGVPVRADVAGGVLTESHFVELISIGGVVAGILDNGQFTGVLTDPRGTPFAGADGVANLASAYGVRASPLDVSQVVDYARLGWDPDLDLVRMGVRDYDAKLSQFLTPDPLYLEDLAKCQGSPVQCALYGYATGNPISFVDPTGLGVWDWVQAEVFTRVVGAGKLVGAGFLAVGSVSACTTGVGCVLGGAGLYYASDISASALQELAFGESESTQLNKAIASFTSQNVANDVELALNFVMVARALSKSPYFAPRDAPGIKLPTAPAAAPATSAEFSRVGRWMNPKELEAMRATGRVQMGEGNVHRVAYPADPGAYKAAPRGDVFATYDVPSSSLRPGGADAWRLIAGPDSVFGRLAARQGKPLPEPPEFVNLKVEMTK